MPGSIVKIMPSRSALSEAGDEVRRLRGSRSRSRGPRRAARRRAPATRRRSRAARRRRSQQVVPRLASGHRRAVRPRARPPTRLRGPLARLAGRRAAREVRPSSRRTGRRRSATNDIALGQHGWSAARVRLGRVRAEQDRGMRVRRTAAAQRVFDGRVGLLLDRARPQLGRTAPPSPPRSPRQARRTASTSSASLDSRRYITRSVAGTSSNPASSSARERAKLRWSSSTPMRLAPSSVLNSSGSPSRRAGLVQHGVESGPRGRHAFAVQRRRDQRAAVTRAASRPPKNRSICRPQKPLR